MGASEVDARQSPPASSGQTTITKTPAPNWHTLNETSEEAESLLHGRRTFSQASRERPQNTKPYNSIQP